MAVRRGVAAEHKRGGLTNVLRAVVGDDVALEEDLVRDWRHTPLPPQPVSGEVMCVVGTQFAAVSYRAERIFFWEPEGGRRGG